MKRRTLKIYSEDPSLKDPTSEDPSLVDPTSEDPSKAAYTSNPNSSETFNDTHNSYDRSLYLLVGVGIIVGIVANAVWLYRHEEKFKVMENFVNNAKSVEKLERKISDLKKEVKILKGDVGKIKTEWDPFEKQFNKTLVDIKYAKTDIAEILKNKIELEKSLQHQKKTVEYLERKLKEEVLPLEPKFKELQLNLSSLQENSDKTHALIEPRLKQQEELFNKINESDNRFTTLNTTLNGINKNVTVIVEQVQGYQDSLKYLNESVEQAKELETNVTKIQEQANGINSSVHDLIVNVTTLRPNVTSLQQAVSDSSTEIEQNQVNLKQLEEDVEKTQNDQNELKVSLTEEKRSLKKLKEDVSNSSLDARQQMNQINNDITGAMKRMSDIQRDVGFYNKSIDVLTIKTGNLSTETRELYVRSDNLAERMERQEKFAIYGEENIPRLVGDFDTLKQSAQTPWFSVMDMVECLVIIVIIVLLLKPHLIARGSHASRDDIFSEVKSDVIKSSSSQRPRSVLDQIQRVPVLGTKICILSFYEETQALHRSLVNSALEMSKRGKAMDIVQFLVRKQEDLLSMPTARYIFVFVDFNERNVILENPGQDLGDKKVVTVQAAQKLGADVFVTYVKDKGSTNLFPGHLYNSELSAFTTHSVLKQLETNQRCFSVYDTFSRSQKEHIGNAIK